MLEVRLSNIVSLHNYRKKLHIGYRRQELGHTVTLFYMTTLLACLTYKTVPYNEQYIC